MVYLLLPCQYSPSPGLLEGSTFSDPLPWLLTPVCGSRSTVRALYGTTNWFKIEKGVRQGFLLSPCLFNTYAEYIMKNARLNELQVGFKIGGRSVNNLSYVDDTLLMAESKEGLKSLLVREESERASLKLNIKKN